MVQNHHVRSRRVLEGSPSSDAGGSGSRTWLGLGHGRVYVRLGEKEQAFSLLNRAFDQYNMWLMNLKVDPRWDSLRSEARFQNLLARVGLQ
jgi:hypothetical protein